MSDRFNYINNDLVKKFNTYGVGIVQPYKKNLLTKISNDHIPSYYFSGKVINHGKIGKPSWNDLLKIFSLNKIVKEIIDEIEPKFITPGKNITSIDDYVYENFCNNNIYPSIFGYGDFPKSTCISINNMVCHCIPYNYKLKEGDVVTVDVCGYNGYHTDIANTYIVPGRGIKDHKKLVNTNRECLEKAIEICKPGQLYKNIGKVVEKHATDNGFKVLTQFNGHGIGKDLHMFPTVYNYKHNSLNDENLEMKVGDMFTIEPLLTEGTNGTTILSDKTSIITADGATSSHFERTIIITENGHLVLN